MKYLHEDVPMVLAVLVIVFIWLWLAWGAFTQ
jgi:hypothetical protein